MRESQVLVTGGAGFIGSHLVRALLAEGARVRVLDNLNTGARENLAGLGVELVEGDIRDPEACRAACRGARYLFHLAAYISVPGSLQDPVSADAINIGGTLNVLMAARDAGVQRVVFSSSSAVYGDTEVLPTHEDVVPRPLSPYGAEKLYGENQCRIFSLHYGLECVAFRYFNVYGPRQNPQSEYAAVIPKFITRLFGGRAPMIFGDGSQTRDFLHVGDVARANILAATTPGIAGEVMNLAGGVATSLTDLTRILSSATGVDLPAEHGPVRQGDIKHSSADIAKVRRLLAFTPTPLEQGLRDTVAHYRGAAA